MNSRPRKPRPTARPSVVARLAGSDELVRLLLDSTGEGIYGIDLDGNCTFANPSCARLLGFPSVDHLLGQHMHALVHHTRANGDPYPETACRIYQALERRAGAHVDDEVFYRADGSSFPAEYWSYPVEREGETVGCVVTFLDVTERRRAERQLREQAAALAEVARFPDMNPGPVLRLDLEATVLLANAAARDLFGTELVGCCWRDLCPAVDEAMWQRILLAREPITVEERSGERVHVFTHRRDPDGNLVFVYGSDVTRERQAERALRQSEKMATLGTLVAGVAHELNNPAAATRRAAEQLREGLARLEQAHLRLEAAALLPAGRELLAELGRRARSQAERPSDLDPVSRADREAEVESWLAAHDVPDPWELAPALVGQGLDPPALQRLEATLPGAALAAALAWAASLFPVYMLLYEIGQGSARISEIVGALKSYAYLGQAPVQAVDLHQGLNDTLVILRSKLKRGITVHRRYGADLPPVPAYGSELNQVWTNLIDNAVDAMGGQGAITIRTRRDGDWAVVDIEDDGPGIPEPARSRIFDPFFTTKSPGQGTGLGLSTSYAIVTEKHGGTFAVASRPGLTCFTVRLPLAAPSPATPGGA